MKKFGFTLAEVLITLGIIGVVAAITMSLLIGEHQKKQTVVQLKKIYSDLQNVIKLSEIDNGPMSEWDFPKTASYADPDASTPFIKKYYLPYLKSARLVKRSEMSGYKMLSGTSPNVMYYVVLSDGAILAFYPQIESNFIWLYVDLNGKKKPNRVGRDVFVFDAYKYSRSGENRYKLRFWSSVNNENNVQELVNDSWYGCNKNNTSIHKNYYCGRLIELNNWEIPKDYPW